jgi:Rps23 Pro-64 3,4-dihydroxylase Tpa1-like proline 4-hydroxylase
MALLEVDTTDGYISFNRDQCTDAGAVLSDAYNTATPFPHAVIDELIEPDLLKSMLDDFPKTDGKTFFDRDQERLKFQFSPAEIPHGALRNLLGELNNEAFIGFLEALTGIKGLIPDPYYVGGGLHETKPGGHLGVHADFNVHGRLNLERRLNLLIYLNDDWSPDFGGDLELWDKAMTGCQIAVAPIMARAVVFNTALDSFHGHPKPLTCPEGRTRRSIATYYYTAPERGIAAIPKRTTMFKPRPATADRTDWSITYQHFVSDWVPPRLQRLAMRLAR